MTAAMSAQSAKPSSPRRAASGREEAIAAPRLSTAPQPHEFTALQDLFDSLLQNQSSLLEVLQRKLDAMRRADVGDLQSALAAESNLVDQLQLLELRRQSVQHQFTQNGKHPPRLSRILALADADSRERLEQLGAALRSRMLQVGALTRVVALVSRGVGDHLRAVIAAVAEAAQPRTGYGRDGKEVAMSAGLVNEVG